jgi:hypothetical protein
MSTEVEVPGMTQRPIIRIDKRWGDHPALVRRTHIGSEPAGFKLQETKLFQ